MSTLHTKVQKKESKTNTQPQSKKTSLIQSNSFDEISQLQSSIGNQAVQKILNVTGVQAKLSVSSPTDSYEKEADSVADKVMNMSDIAVKKQTPVKIQQKTTQSDTSESISPSIESKINSLQGKGTPLSYKTKSFFTSRFGHDLSDVRVHTNTDSNNLAESINAKAFTKGNNIVFNKGEYNPQSSHGKRLLGHELTHVIQQKQNNIFRKEKIDNEEGVNIVASTPSSLREKIIGIERRNENEINDFIKDTVNKGAYSYAQGTNEAADAFIVWWEEKHKKFNISDSLALRLMTTVFSEMISKIPNASAVLNIGKASFYSNSKPVSYKKIVRKLKNTLIQRKKELKDYQTNDIFKDKDKPDTNGYSGLWYSIGYSYIMGSRSDAKKIIHELPGVLKEDLNYPTIILKKLILDYMKKLKEQAHADADFNSKKSYPTWSQIDYLNKTHEDLNNDAERETTKTLSTN